MDIKEAIMTRRSVRDYDGHSLSEYQRQEIGKAIAGAVSPFGGSVAIRLADYELKGAFRPSTYGVIKGARSFLLLAYGADVLSALSAGYMLEAVVLRATELGLGTCWVGGTFRGGTFDRGIEWADGLSLKVISPVGNAAEGKSLLARLTSAMARSRSRKPFGELFFDGEWGRPLTENSPWSEALEMMRLAPSSVNSQPWRAVVDGEGVHFYAKLRGNLSMVDMGIGLCHFAAVAPQGEWEIGKAPGLGLSGRGHDVPRPYERVASYKADVRR